MPFVPAGVRPPEPFVEPLYFVVHRKGIVVRRDAARGGKAELLGAADAGALALSGEALAGGEHAHYLGRLDGRDAFAVAAPADIAAPFEVANLRFLYGDLDDTTFSVAGRATQIVDWAATHRYCGACATPTVRVDGERSMRCPACGLSAYPRIAPAIIVLVRKGDLALLAHGARFPAPFYSTLAGFVEPGESLEECLLREVKEEAGIEVGNLRYFGSQSWPFPHSLMVGFFADYVGGDLVLDPTEIVDAKWFRHDELPMIPPPLSISRQLIDAWVADVTRST